jgi:recombination protein RecT
MSQEIQATTAAGDGKPGSRTLRSFLEGDAAQAKLAEVATKYMQPADLVRLTLLAVSRQPDLLKCTQTSVLRALMDAATMGIMPGGTMGRGYLVPRKNKVTGTLEATFDPGYRGLIDIARRSGKVKAMDAKAVYQGDVFEYEEGLDKKLRHVPSLDAKTRGDIIAAYAIARFYDGDPQIEVLTRADIDKIRNSSASKNGPWLTWYEEMARKSAVRRICKFLPYDPVLEKAIELATAAESRMGQGDNLLEVSRVGDSRVSELETKLRDAKSIANQASRTVDVDIDMDPVPPSFDESEPGEERSESKPASVHDLDAQLRGHQAAAASDPTPAVVAQPTKERKPKTAPTPQGAPRAVAQQSTIGEFPGDPPRQTSATQASAQVSTAATAPPLVGEDAQRAMVIAWRHPIGVAVVHTDKNGNKNNTTTASAPRIFGGSAVIEINDGLGLHTLVSLDSIVPWSNP